jgi:hypothetical protein
LLLRRKSRLTNCMEALTFTVGSLSEYDAAVIASELTKPNSEFQQEVLNRHGSKTPIAIVRDGSWRIVAWVASHLWQEHQTLEGFTLPSHRRRGCARAAAAMLAANGDLDPKWPTAVFSQDCIEIARSIGCRDIHLFEFRDGKWRRNS